VSRTILKSILLLVLAACGARGQTFGGAPIRSISFLNAATGLAVYEEPGLNLYKFTRDGQQVIPDVSGASQLTIQDSNVAWCTIGRALMRGDRGWTRWTFVDTDYVHNLVGCSPGKLYFMSEGVLCSATSDGIVKDTGIAFPDSLVALDYLSAKMIFALGGSGLYRSTDGGYQWEDVYPTTAQGLYADRAHGLVYVGGYLRVSRDLGITWQELPGQSQYPFVTLYGPVYGAHDCTGDFYVGGAGNFADVYRYSEDNFFHNIGPLDLRGKAYVFDGGAIIYALSQRLISFTGGDGTLTDSARSHISVIADTANIDLCSTGHDSIILLIDSHTCLPIALDSIRLLGAKGVAKIVSTHTVLTGNTYRVALPYAPRSIGVDSVSLRLIVHSIEGRGYPESVDVRAYRTVTGSPAVLAVPKQVSFTATHIDSVHTALLTIQNAGCERLRVDSVVSSRPSLFQLSSSLQGQLVEHADSARVTITYHPTTVGQDLESIEIGTSAGHRFVTVSGLATQDLNVEDRPADASFEIESDLVNNRFTVTLPHESRLDLVNSLGEVVQSWLFPAGSSAFRLDSEPNGVYLFRASGLGVKRIMVLR
jgi:hypothetical protein